MPDSCPDCDIIIISYGIIPGQCDTLKHRSLAIEEMYGKVIPHPALHLEVVKTQEEISKMLEDANNKQLALLKRLSKEPRTTGT